LALAPFISELDGAAHVAIRVTPRASRAGLGGVRGEVLVLRVSAPPAEGKANAAVRSLIAKACGVPAGRVVLVRGKSSREKVVRIEGMSAAEASRRLRATS
jgi:uncharacterized protein